MKDGKTTIQDAGLINRISKKSDIPAEQIKEIIDLFKEEIFLSLENDERVVLFNLGAFHIRNVPAHNFFSKNLQKLIAVPQTKAVSFKSAVPLRQRLKKLK